MEKIDYELSFDETVANVNAIVDRWFAGPKQAPPSVQEIAEPIYFKNSESVIVYANDEYERFFYSGRSTIGRIATTYLDSSVSQVSKQSDSLVFSGVREVRFVHECIGPDGDWYLLETYKRNLLDFHDGAYELLGISRPVTREALKGSTDVSIEEKHLRFLQLDADFRVLCTLIAEGRSQKEIASALDVSVKTVENRRRKIVEELSLENTIEIVKLLVRFEERGLATV